MSQSRYNFVTEEELSAVQDYVLCVQGVESPSAALLYSMVQEIRLLADRVRGYEKMESRAAGEGVRMGWKELCVRVDATEDATKKES